MYITQAELSIYNILAVVLGVIGVMFWGQGTISGEKTTRWTKALLILAIQLFFFPPFIIGALEAPSDIARFGRDYVLFNSGLPALYLAAIDILISVNVLKLPPDIWKVLPQKPILYIGSAGRERMRRIFPYWLFFILAVLILFVITSDSTVPRWTFLATFGITMAFSIAFYIVTFAIDFVSSKSAGNV